MIHRGQPSLPHRQVWITCFEPSRIVLKYWRADAAEPEPPGWVSNIKILEIRYTFKVKQIINENYLDISHHSIYLGGGLLWVDLRLSARLDLTSFLSTDDVLCWCKYRCSCSVPKSPASHWQCTLAMRSIKWFTACMAEYKSSSIHCCCVPFSADSAASALTRKCLSNIRKTVVGKSIHSAWVTNTCGGSGGYSISRQKLYHE